jgi:flavin reductase (DIM6/NTAB) family NADH-FMN oxidoreductase RutF
MPLSIQLAIKEGLLPIDSPPVGLVSWYAPDGRVVIAVSSWVAMVNGPPPELRAGGGGLLLEGNFPEGCDFVVALLRETQLPIFASLVRHAAGSSEPVTIASDPLLTPAALVHAPLLTGAALQIECARGHIIAGTWETELAGRVRLLHRGHQHLSPDYHPDFCALHPLRPHIPR